MTLTAAEIGARLAGASPPLASPRLRRAAVAVVLELEPSPRVLLIERAVRKDDRWSGQVAFPGGLESPSDGGDLQATAARETLEEVGLDLGHAGMLLGRMAPHRAIARGGVLPMTITPYVFQATAAFEPRLNEEVAASFWLPLDAVVAGALDDRHVHRVGPMPFTFPCWRFEGRVVWGLTYQMLRTFLDLTAPNTTPGNG